MAAEHGLDVFVIDGRVVAHPSILSAWRVNGLCASTNKSQAIRPKSVVAAQGSPNYAPALQHPTVPGVPLQRLPRLADRETTNRLKLGQNGEVIVLKRLYNLMTGLPGARRDYTELDFARDVHALATSGQWTTRSGNRASFPASTGTKNVRQTIQYINRHGEPGQVLRHSVQRGAS